VFLSKVFFLLKLNCYLEGGTLSSRLHTTVNDLFTWNKNIPAGIDRIRLVTHGIVYYLGWQRFCRFSSYTVVASFAFVMLDLTMAAYFAQRPIHETNFSSHEPVHHVI
jgi:hypothetical protein